MRWIVNVEREEATIYSTNDQLGPIRADSQRDDSGLLGIAESYEIGFSSLWIDAKQPQVRADPEPFGAIRDETRAATGAIMVMLEREVLDLSRGVIQSLQHASEAENPH